MEVIVPPGPTDVVMLDATGMVSSIKLDHSPDWPTISHARSG